MLVQRKLLLDGSITLSYVSVIFLQFITDGSNQSVVTDPQSFGSLRKRSLVIQADVNHYSSADNSPRDSIKVRFSGRV